MGGTVDWARRVASGPPRPQRVKLAQGLTTQARRALPIARALTNTPAAHFVECVCPFR